MNSNVIFTIVAKNYLAYAKVLCESVCQFNEVDFIIFVVDDSNNLERKKNIRNYNPKTKELLEMSFFYDVTEYCTALKPYIIEDLLDEGYQKIVYLDPDIYCYASLEAIFSRMNKYPILLTNHLNYPISVTHAAITEEDLLLSGTFNLGFIGLCESKSTREFVSWWKKKLYLGAFKEDGQSMFFDQKWINFISSYWDEQHDILRHPGMNMAVWNLHERYLTSNDGNSIVDIKGNRSPLYFFHFSGFSPAFPEVISRKHTVANFDRYPELKSLFSNYSQDLYANDFEKHSKIPYGFSTFYNGYPILKLHRRLFAEAKKRGMEFGDPFCIGDNSYFQYVSRNSLLIAKKASITDRLGTNDVSGFSTSAAIIKALMRMICRFIGAAKYSLFIRYLNRITSFGQQIFLIRKIK
jgi:hypothetical protein